MNLKTLPIKVMDVLVYISFIFVFFISGIAVMSGQILNGIVFFVTGIVVVSIFSAFWMVLSNINEEAVKQTKILEQILKGN